MQSRYPAVAATFKRNRQKRRPVIHVLPGQVLLRVVCHASVVGGVIGSNGAIVSQLRRETDTKIHCEPPVKGSEHWIVYIVGSCSIDKRVVLTDRVDDGSGGEDGDWVVCDASAAQAALIRVLERVWTVLAKKDGDGGGEEEAYCGMLADRAHIGAVLGKGGKNVEWIRGETGAKIRILPPPSCGGKGDELIQITGGALAVKKALIMVSGRLQECPPVDGYQPPFPTKAFKKPVNENSRDPHLEFFPHLSSFLPPISGSNVTEVASSGLSSTDAEGNSNNTDTKDTEQEVVFRMICNSDAAGGIIGKKGAIVRALRNETGASIMVGTPSAVSGERVVTVSAHENLESWHSPAQNALVLVFARSIEIDIEKGLLPGLHEGATVKARLLVPLDFVNSSGRNRGGMLSEIMEATGADMQVLEGEHMFECVPENQVVMEIVGEYQHVQSALFQVTASLRDNQLPSEFVSEVRARSSYESAGASYCGLHQPSSISPDSSQDSTRAHKIESSIPGNAGTSLMPNLQLSQTVGRSVSNGREDLMTTGSSTELEKSLDLLLPTEVLDVMGPRSIKRELKDNFCSGFREALAPFSDSNQENKMAQRMNQLGLSNNGEASSPNLCASIKKPISVRNITLEIAVAENALVTLCGRGDGSLNNLLQVSGAKVDVHDPTDGEGIIVISGSPEQVRAAMSLIMSIISDQ